MTEAVRTYPIKITTCTSADIQEVARLENVSHMREIGSGYAKGINERGEAVVDHEGEASWYVRFYEFSSGQRVAETNGDTLWEEEDQAEFANLAERCGVQL